MALLLLAFFSIFIFEGFGPDFTWQDSLSHLFLSLLILFALLIAWKHPQAGAWLFIILGIVFAWFFHPFLWAGLIIGTIFALTGMLFWLASKN